MGLVSSPRAPQPGAEGFGADAAASTDAAAGEQLAAGQGATAAKRTARAGVRLRRRARAALAPDDPRRAVEAEAIAAAILPHVPSVEPPTAGSPTADPPPVDPRTVASYVALPSEPSTEALHAQLLARGVRVIVPVLLPDLDLDWAVLGQDSPGGTRLGREAIASAALVVVPALQVDVAGRRLGQGGGSYDRALARQAQQAVVVAVVDDDGLVAAVPHEPHDARVTAAVRPGAGWTTLPTAESICENR